MNKLLNIYLITFLSSLFISFVTISNAQDNTCKDINLWPQMWKVRDQGLSGACFAHAAAYLVDYTFKSKSKPVWRISASDLAVKTGAYAYRKYGIQTFSFNIKDFKEDKYYGIPGMHGGNTILALETGLNTGFCSYSKMPDDNLDNIAFLNAFASHILNYYYPQTNWPKMIEEYNQILDISQKQIALKSVVNAVKTTFSTDFFNLVTDNNADIDKLYEHDIFKRIIANCKKYMPVDESTSHKCSAVMLGLLKAYKEFFIKANDSEIEMILHLMFSSGFANFHMMNESNNSKTIQKYLDTLNKYSSDNSYPIIIENGNRFLRFPFLVDLISGMLDIRCHERLKPEKYLYKTGYIVRKKVSKNDHISLHHKIHKAESKRMQRAIDDNLSLNRPVQISYKTEGIVIPSQSTIQPIDINSDHASVLIGRKMINNKCHYLLLNSWGPNWIADSRKIDNILHVKDKNNKPIGGMIYVERDKMIYHTDLVTILKFIPQSSNENTLNYSNNSFEPKKLESKNYSTADSY
jgi:hypothetical protein